MKPALFFIVVLALAVPGTTMGADDKLDLSFPTEAETKDEGVKVVKEFMDLMIKEWTSKGKEQTQAARMKLLSQEYLKSREIDPKAWKMNQYGFEEYEVQDVKRCYVVVKGSNRTNGWSHVVTFRLLKEGKKLRIEPSHADPSKSTESRYITPWWTVKEHVR
jgi:hypothetical protein